MSCYGGMYCTCSKLPLIAFLKLAFEYFSRKILNTTLNDANSRFLKSKDIFYLKIVLWCNHYYQRFTSAVFTGERGEQLSSLFHHLAHRKISPSKSLQKIFYYPTKHFHLGKLVRVWTRVYSHSFHQQLPRHCGPTSWAHSVENEWTAGITNPKYQTTRLRQIVNKKVTSIQLFVSALQARCLSSNVDITKLLVKPIQSSSRTYETCFLQEQKN